MTPLPMREQFLERILVHMAEREDIVFLTGDFGAMAINQMRVQFPERFINVGVAEQNLVNVGIGMALEGYIVYCYSIAAFLVMRAYEQIRTGISLLSQLRPMNINLIGIGAGVSYDVSGPSHHCLEDVTVMRVLPNVTILSPSDAAVAGACADWSVSEGGAKYVRLDARPLPALYEDLEINRSKGLTELRRGEGLCLIATGYMTHTALRVAAQYQREGGVCGVIDVFQIKPLHAESLREVIMGRYHSVLILEEGFAGGGGLGGAVQVALAGVPSVTCRALGCQDRYVFDALNRDDLHRTYGLGDEVIRRTLHDLGDSQ